MSNAMTHDHGQRPQRKRATGKKPRHIPLRTCVACGESRPKRELIRIVRTPDGHVVLDPTGKKSGRGAYLCAKRSCWEPALRKGKLERDFGVTLTPEDRAELEAYIETLPVEEASAPKQTRRKPRNAPTQATGDTAS
jgi:predicted RNA-binding protein YlxR (DUF448 family)